METHRIHAPAVDAASRSRRRQRIGLFAVIAAVSTIGVLAVAAPAIAASVTVKAHPVLNSGAGSALTASSTFSSSGHVSRFNGLTYTFSGTTISQINFRGAKTTVGTNDSSTISASFLNSAGTSIGSASTTLTGALTTFSQTSTVVGAPSLPTYSAVAKTKLTLTETLVATRDAFIQGPSAAPAATIHDNEGANTVLTVSRNTATDRTNRAVVSFDFATISTTGLTSATLVLTISSAASWVNGDTVTVYRVNASGTDWTQGNGNGATKGTGAGNTWNCTSDTDITDNGRDCAVADRWLGADPGGTWGATPTAAAVAINQNQTGTVSFNVTADVVAGTTRGWLIKKTVETTTASVNFSSREAGVGVAPKLVLVFGQ